MKKRAIPFIVSIGLTLLSFTVNSNHIRDDFHDAVESECKLQTIIVSKTYPNNQVTKAYKGLATCTSAEFATWPTTKWKYFTDGKALIKESIKSAPQNPEIRYVRLMVQLNAPALVGYSSEIDEDLKIFVQYIGDYAVDADWKTSFIINLKTSDGISATQIAQLTTVQTNIN